MQKGTRWSLSRMPLWSKVTSLIEPARISWQFRKRALYFEFYVYDVHTSWWRPITTWMDHQAIHVTFIDGASYGVIEWVLFFGGGGRCRFMALQAVSACYVILLCFVDIERPASFSASWHLLWRQFCLQPERKLLYFLVGLSCFSESPMPHEVMPCCRHCGSVGQQSPKTFWEETVRSLVYSSSHLPKLGQNIFVC